MKTPLDHLLLGEVEPLGHNGLMSGIAKQPVEHAAWLNSTGFDGDAQADRKRHGGPEKAVHHYPAEHYDLWRRELGEIAILGEPGAFGENLSTHGLDETSLAVGDIFKLGGAIIEVSQGRQPCHKLNVRFGISDMAQRVQTTGRTGWYYRVLQEGLVTPDDSLDLIDRKAPEWTLHRLWRLLYVDRMNLPELEAMAALPHLAESWRGYARRRLESRQVEDWSKRLTGLDSNTAQMPK